MTTVSNDFKDPVYMMHLIGTQSIAHVTSRSRGNPL